jgi:acetyl esterase/lipase
MMNARDHQAIIIAPDYPLGPEANYQDIVDSLKDFLNFYKDDVCFEPGYENKGWTSWLVDQISSKRNVKGITIQTGRIFVEGESAGGNAAATALFLNAEKDHGTKIPIKVALLRYPMLAHYRRDFQSGMEYMGHKPPFQKRDELVKQLDLILGERDKLESAGYLPTRGRSAAPENMSAAFLLSVLHKWEESFKRKKPGQMVPDSFVNKDCIERANDSVDRVDATLLPAMYIYHGANDTNCPLADTNKFVKVLREKYPKQYTEDTLKLSIVPDKTHGFDYELVSEDVEWLKKAYDYVEKHWIEQPIK